VWVKKVEKNWCRYGAVVNNQSTFNDCCLDIIYNFVKMRKSAKTERVELHYPMLPRTLAPANN